MTKKAPPVDDGTPVPAKEKKAKVAGAPAFDRGAEIKALRGEINKHFGGRGHLMAAEDFSNVFLLRRPTGIMQLDLAIAGGLPAGGLTEVIGADGTTKSYLANLIMAGVQRVYGPDAALAAFMSEMPFDKLFAKQHCGMRVPLSDDEIAWRNKARIEGGLAPFQTPEELAWLKDGVGFFDAGIYESAEALLEAAVSVIERNLHQVVLIDSFGALITAAEVEAKKGIEDKHYGGASGPITAFMHRLHAALNTKDQWGRMNMTTVIGINQYRDNVGGGQFAPEMRFAGGRALRHGKLVSIKMDSGAKIRVGPEGKQIVIGKAIRWEIMKGKAGCHDGPKGEYGFHFGHNGGFFGADIYTDALVCGLLNGVLTQDGGANIFFTDTSEELGRGKENAALFLHYNPHKINEIRSKVFSKAGISYLIKEP